MATRALNVVITGDSKGIGLAARETEGHFRAIQRSAKITGQAVRIGFGIAAAGTLVGVAALKKSAEAAKEAEASHARMAAQLKASGISYRAHAREIDNVIQKTSRLAGLDDEDLQDAFTNIVRSTGSVSKGLRGVGLAADIARAKHIDVAKAGQLVGKVASGNVTALARYGIQIDKNSTSQQALAELQRRFAGQAEAYGKTAAGAQDRFSVAIENVQEKLGAKLLPALGKAANAVSGFLTGIDRGTGAGGRFAHAMSSAAATLRGAWGGAVSAVHRFIERNRDDIQSVQRAVRNVATAVRAIIHSVLIPAFKIILPALRGVVEGVLTALRGLVRIISGVLTGDWRKAWQGLKDIAAGVLKAIVSLFRGSGELLLTAARGAGKGIAKGIMAGVGNLGHVLLAKVKDAVGWVGGHIGSIGSSIGKKLNPFGDGIGKPSAGMLPSGGGAVGSLKGARSSLAPFAAIGAKFGLGVSSGRRPGSITSSGNPSYHSSGEAIDMADGRGPDAAKLGFFRYMKSHFGGRLAELIYTPGGAGIKDGHPYRYTGKVAADHFDHVHVAFDTGQPGVGDGLGRFSATSYGPPWGGIQGTGVTATGVNLKGNPHTYGVAVDPRVIPLGSKLKITPNPFNYSGAFTAFDTGGAIKGNRIDFYDWRGRSAQMGWGTRTVSVEIAGGGGGGSGGGGGGGTRARTLTPAQRTASTRAAATHRAAAGAEGAQRELATHIGPGQGGYGQHVADVQLREATARSRDNLAGLLKALNVELKLKRKRLAKIRKTLKRRLKGATRKALTEEATTLVGEIGDLQDTIKEYRADQRGGATTVTRAEQLDAGVNNAAGTGGGGDVGGGDTGSDAPTEADYLDAALAQAELTPDTADDRAALTNLQAFRQRAYDAAVAGGDPRAIAQAARDLKSINDTLAASVPDLTQAIKDLQAEVKRQTDFATAVSNTSNYQLTQTLADLISGHIVGRGVAGRAFTPGSGVEYSY